MHISRTKSFPTLARLFILCSALLCTTVHAGGRPDNSYRDWFGHVGGGFNLAQGDFGDVVDNGLAFRGGATWWPADRPFGIQIEAAFSTYDISSSTIRAINDAIDEIDPESGGVSGGDIDDWSFSVNAIWSLGGSTSEGFYLMAGIGIDNVEGRLTNDGLVYYPPVCDPWWWWCIPGGVGPGTVVVASKDSTEFSWNVGVGYSFALTGSSLMYVEARYKSVQTDPETTQVVPLTFGLRW